MKVAEIRPEFPDLEHGIRRDELCIEAGLPFEGEQVRVRRRADFEWIPNTRNDYFQLRYVFPVGSRHNRLWQLAGAVTAPVAGTETRSAEALKLELYRLAGLGLGLLRTGRDGRHDQRTCPEPARHRRNRGRAADPSRRQR